MRGSVIILINLIHSNYNLHHFLFIIDINIFEVCIYRPDKENLCIFKVIFPKIPPNIEIINNTTSVFIYLLK